MEVWCVIGLWWLVLGTLTGLCFLIIKWWDKKGLLDEFTDEDRQGW